MLPTAAPRAQQHFTPARPRRRARARLQKKRPQATQTFRPNPVQAPPKAGITAAKPPAAAPAPAPGRPPFSAAHPPPETLQGGQIRTQARTAYSTAVGQYKNSLVQAALRLGSPEIIQALMRDPSYAEYAGVLSQGMNDPGSQMSLLNQQEQQGLQGVDEASNARNAFFSGYRLQDRGRLSEDFGNQRRGAVDEFRTGAQTETQQGLAQALADYNAAMNQALGIDIDTALSQEPEPGATPAPKAPKPPSGHAGGGQGQGHGTGHQGAHANQNQGQGSTKGAKKGKKGKRLKKKQHYKPDKAPNTKAHLGAA